MNNITYSKKSIANPSNREKTDRELYLEAKSLLNMVLANYTSQCEYSLMERESIEKRIKQFLKQ